MCVGPSSDVRMTLVSFINSNDDRKSSIFVECTTLHKMNKQRKKNLEFHFLSFVLVLPAFLSRICIILRIDRSISTGFNESVLFVHNLNETYIAIVTISHHTTVCVAGDFSTLLLIRYIWLVSRDCVCVWLVRAAYRDH